MVGQGVECGQLAWFASRILLDLTLRSLRRASRRMLLMARQGCDVFCRNRICHSPPRFSTTQVTHARATPSIAMLSLHRPGRALAFLISTHARH
jgi:hypothetical protein